MSQDQGRSVRPSGLFRAEAIAHATQLRHDGALDSAALGEHAISAAVGVFVVALAALLSFGSIHDTLSASGHLLLGEGRVRVRAPIAGTVSRVYVQREEAVLSGDPLMLIDPGLLDATGDRIDRADLAALNAQISALDAQITTREDLARAEGMAKERAAQVQGETLASLRREQAMRERDVEITAARLRDAMHLAESGAIARDGLAAIEREALVSAMTLERIRRDRTDALARLASLADEAAVEQHTHALARYADLQRRAALERERARATVAVEVQAAGAGRIVDLRVRPGDRVIAGALLAERLVNEQGTVRVELQVDPSAAGDIHSGQRVSLRIPALAHLEETIIVGRVGTAPSASRRDAGRETFEVGVEVIAVPERLRSQMRSGMRVEAVLLGRSVPLWRLLLRMPKRALDRLVPPVATGPPT